MSRHYFFNLPTPQWEEEGPAMATSTMGRVSASGGRTSPANDIGRIGHREALRRLGLNARTVAKLMARTAPDDTPWVDIGSGSQHHYRWKADALDAWLQRVAGASVADEQHPARPSPRKKRKPSRREPMAGTEKATRSQLGQSGSLVRLVVDNSTPQG